MKETETFDEILASIGDRQLAVGIIRSDDRWRVSVTFIAGGVLSKVDATATTITRAAQLARKKWTVAEAHYRDRARFRKATA